MPTLRITQTGLPNGEHRVQLDLTGDGMAQSAFAQFPFTLADQDREDLRWYLEDYLQYPIDPAPEIADRVEQRMRTLGAELYTHLFDGNPATRRLWARLEPELAGMRVEVASEVDADAVLPWELLHDPHSNTDLAVHASSFVRVQRQTARPAVVPQVGAAERIRVLLIICRPGGRQDVPFRSVASHLVRLSATAREVFQLEVLRPPTFAQLARVLRQAASRGEPYHVVHFDGHGTWAELPGAAAVPDGGAGTGRSALRYGGPGSRPGPHGYLLFENPEATDNIEHVDGLRLGNLLAETAVPVLVLNACQSARADLSLAPQDVTTAPADVQTRVRAYGSLAQEVVDAGVAGVVAMRYSVYVVTAAQFIGDLYAALLEGLPLGSAVSRGRKQLAAQPNREIAFEARPLQDWVVPVVYEAVPVNLFPAPRSDEQLHITLNPAQAGRERGLLDPSLPAGPDAGFYGRDETLLALDRAFDHQRVVLLYAFAGAGKTSTAVEFARWYAHTGGIQGPVLFTSFERHLTLGGVLDQLGAAYEQQLERVGIQWLTLDEPQRRQVALELVAQVPLLWIWDNVEPVAGFPTGNRSAWSDQEQQQLAGFLRTIQDTKAKVLVTSRRDEQEWLGGVPRRVQLPPMPMAEGVQLARAVADKQGHRLTEVADWRPLLAYAQGNPLTITVLVSQALRAGLHSRMQVAAFVASLQGGEAAVADDEQQGRARSLGASLGYGFAHAFDEQERAQLALLHLFRGCINVDALPRMGRGHPRLQVAGVPELANVDRQAVIGLLDRAAEIGLLTSLGHGWYRIHPALPWFLAGEFAQHYGTAGAPGVEQATHAFATAVSNLGNAYLADYMAGRGEAVTGLRLEEANFLRARGLARTNGWWDQAIDAMQGLRGLYEHTGRWIEWARLVEELIPDLVDPATGGPLSEREHAWHLLTGYRVSLAFRAQDWTLGQRLGQTMLAWDRQNAATALAVPPAELDDRQRQRIRSLAVTLQLVGTSLREQGQSDCITYFQEALELYQRIQAGHEAAMLAFGVGQAYLDLPDLDDLDEAERLFQLSYHELGERDRLRRALALGELGRIAHERFRRAPETPDAFQERREALDRALVNYRQALALLPDDSLDNLALIHRRIGNIYEKADEVASALHHYQQSIHLYETTGSRYDAAMTRYNAALALAHHERFDDALPWAQAALRDYQTLGNRAAAEMARTQELIGLVTLAQQGGRTRTDPGGTE